jgi:Zn-dependent protease with chaperone function
MRYLNIVLSILYALTSIFIFFVLQIIACALPLISGLLSFYLFWQAFSRPPGSLYLIAIGGAIGSFMTFTNLLKSIKGAVSTPENTNILEDSKVISLIQNVSNDVGISPFQAVYLNSELDISTFYIGRGRYLNLSAIALNYLTEQEMRAVIAHECAHHHNNAMLLNRTHYRAVILFESFANTLAGTFSTFEKLAKKNVLLSQLFGSGMLTLLPLIPCLYMYRFFLLLMATLTRDAEYEYYCDSVAAKYVGGNILASALQKLFDLHLAHYRFLKRKGIIVDGNLEFGSVEQLYLEGLNREFLHIRYFNPADRTEAASRKTDTHPPVALRLKRSQAFSSKLDSSEPLWSEAEVNFWLHKLPEPSFLKTEKQKKNRSDSIRKAQETTGKAFITFNRKSTLAGSSIRKYEIFIDDECVGVLDKKNNTGCYEVDPGLHIVYIKVAKRKSEELELIVSGSNQIEILFWNLPDGNLHVGLK